MEFPDLNRSSGTNKLSKTSTQENTTSFPKPHYASVSIQSLNETLDPTSLFRTNFQWSPNGWSKQTRWSLFRVVFDERDKRSIRRSLLQIFQTCVTLEHSMPLILQTPVSFSQSITFESVYLLANQNPNEQGRSESPTGERDEIQENKMANRKKNSSYTGKSFGIRTQIITET